MSEAPEVLDIIECGRCGERHMVKVHSLSNPTDEWRWWATCPATSEPILITVTGEKMKGMAEELGIKGETVEKWGDAYALKLLREKARQSFAEAEAERLETRRKYLLVLSVFENHDALEAFAEGRVTDGCRHALEAQGLLAEVVELSDG